MADPAPSTSRSTVRVLGAISAAWGFLVAVYAGGIAAFETLHILVKQQTRIEDEQAGLCFFAIILCLIGVTLLVLSISAVRRCRIERANMIVTAVALIVFALATLWLMQPTGYYENAMLLVYLCVFTTVWPVALIALLLLRPPPP